MTAETQKVSIKKKKLHKYALTNFRYVLEEVSMKFYKKFIILRNNTE